MRRAWRTLAVTAIGAASVVGTGSPASGGGSWLYPAHDTYEAGDAALLVGYVGPGQLGWVDNGPFDAWLRTGSTPDGEEAPVTGDAAGDVSLGPLTIEPTGDGGWRALRIWISFVVPDDLAPGRYDIVYRGCTNAGIGDLVGGWIWVGVPPLEDYAPSWPPDEPAWALRGTAPATSGAPTTTSAAAPITTTTAAQLRVEVEPASVRPTNGTRIEVISAVGFVALGAIVIAARRVQGPA